MSEHIVKKVIRKIQFSKVIVRCIMKTAKEGDTLNQAIYHIQRYVETNEGNEAFGDGSHILYVNGKYRGNDEIGKLMHDFSCTNPDDINYEILAKKARYFKQDEKKS